MKHRIKNIIATLKSLPEPKFIGQVMEVQVVASMLESVVNLDPETEINLEPMKNITVKSEQFCYGSHKWLEWVIDI